MLKNILKKLRHVEVSANNKIDSLFAGNYKSAFRGRGVEFADIRAYDTGDDIRDIDWKTTSKQGGLFVKTYHESRDNTLFFLVDGSAIMQFSSVPEMKYERLLEVFSLLAFSAIKNGDRVGILWYDQEKIKIFPPKKGKKNLLQILLFCIEQYLHPSKKIKKRVEKEKVFQKLFTFLKHSSSIFWLTGEVAELSLSEKKYLKMLRYKHDFTPVIFSDPFEESLAEEGNFSFQDPFSEKISFVTLTPEIAIHFKKIQIIQQRKFQDFFQKQRAHPLFITSKENIFKTLFLFFQSRQKTSR